MQAICISSLKHIGFQANDQDWYLKFDGYNGSYKIDLIGLDTLILVGDEKQVYVRFKN
jgi:hypothetical protein